MTFRLAPTAAVAAALVLVLAGCVPTTPQEDTTMDHVEAKAQLVTLLEAAQDAIGGEWERSDAGAQTCTLAGGGDGASYSLVRLGPAVELAQQQAIVDRVVAVWAEQDVEAFVTTKPEVEGVVVTQVRYPEAEVDPDGFYIELWISDRASNIAGQTRCATGDAADINAP